MKLPGDRHGLLSRHARPWLFAVFTAIACSAISVNVSFFHSIPYALAFLAITIFATVYGMPLSVFLAILSIAARAVFRAIAFPGQPVLTYFDLLASGVTLIAAILVSLLTRNRRRASSQLEIAHVALQERTDALVESLHSSKCASWTLDADSGNGPQWYGGSYQILGRPFAEAEQLDSFLALLHPEDRDRIAGLIQQLKTAVDPVLCEFRAPWPNGDLHWFEMRATRVPGSAPLWRGLTMDITERKCTESALLRSEKLAAMGRLASTVAHEINNPLEAVTNLLYLAQKDTNLSPGTQAYLVTAEQELARLGDITRLTLGFVRSSSTRRNIEIAPIADEVLSIFRHRLESKGVHIERIYQPEVSVEIAPHELRQILTNLISNAADAVNGTPSCIAIRIQQDGASAVQLIVEDSGTGIDPAALPRIFEPFFTTKDDIGTGIGLWVTRELVESNGGRINAESGTLLHGVKTRFTIEFPAAG